MTVKVSQFGGEAAAFLAELHSCIFAGGPEQSWTAKDFADLLEIKGTLAFVISCDDQPAAMVLVRYILDEAEILTFGVIPEFRGQGYAGKLLTEMADVLQQKDVENIFLDVRTDNQNAIRSYEKAGYVISGKRNDYYYHSDGSKTDAYFMSLNLSDIS